MDILKRLTNCKVFSTATQEEDPEAWLAARSRGIGGSDVGTICGVNSFSCARQLYLKKTGQRDGETFDDAANERMHFGHMLEPIVADEYERRSGNKVVVSPATLVHKDIPWALANVDRLIVDEQGIPYGILECKTAGEYMKNKWEQDEFGDEDSDMKLPMSYIYQLQWYLFITGLKHGVLACLVGGNKFYYYDIPYDENLVENELLPKVTKFWTYNVKNLVEPELDGSDAAAELVKEENTDVLKNSEMTLSTDIENELAKTVVECKAKIKELERILAGATNQLKDKLKTTEIGYTQDHTIKWSPRSQTRVDTDRLKADYPEIYNACKKLISFRVFTVK